MKTGNGISISMIRLCSDVTALCNRKSWIPVVGCYPRAIFVLSGEILLYLVLNLGGQITTRKSSTYVRYFEV